MGAKEKIEAGAEKATGKVKEAVGDATDNERLQAEGQADQASGEVRQKVEQVKDVFR